jgi:hypothetical protein
VAETTLLGILIQYVAPTLLGGIGGLLTPFGQWGIEQRRQRLQARRDLVSTWRKTLIPLLNAEPQAEVGTAGYRYAFMQNENYASLRPHLRPEVVKQLEGQTVHVVVGDIPFPRTLIVEEIGRIERQWNLV